jgi:hypothetical protein
MFQVVCAMISEIKQKEAYGLLFSILMPAQFCFWHSYTIINVTIAMLIE